MYAQASTFSDKKRSNEEFFHDEDLRALQAKQQHVGVTMGRLGCVLANDARRKGFLDDEAFEDIVFSEGEGNENEGR